MRGLRRRRRTWGGTERATVGLAAVAVATVGSVVAGEVVRLARSRARVADDPEGVLDTAEHAIEAAGWAGRDAIAVALEGYETASRRETVLFNLLSGFVLSFALMRLSTHGIRRGWWPTGDVHLGGRHIHHFVPGILLAFGSGTAALITDSDRIETALAVPFGAGLGLTFDEAALLLDLRDVYWSREGLLSVQLSLGLAALLGGTILALRMLRRGERRAAELGLVPAIEVEQYAWSG